MNIVIVGCGRVGGRLGTVLDAEGHKVTVMDIDEDSFRFLGPGFRGDALLGDGTDDDDLVKADIDDTDVFIAATDTDSCNLLASQKAKIQFKVPKVVCRLYDPVQKDLFRDLGLETVTPTTVTVELLKDAIER
jgi:trk system potassium uptake protein TrkA